MRPVGKYVEVLAVAGNWLLLDSQATQALQWKDRATTLQRLIRDYESAMNEMNPSQASAALDRIGQLNPADPSLSERRRRIQPAAMTNVSRPPPTLDKGVMSRRRRGEQVYSWQVEHKHRRGTCGGALLLDPDTVEYKAKDEGHNFRLPIRSSQLQVEGTKLTIVSSAGEAHNFELKIEAAKDLKGIWDKFIGGTR